MSLWTSHCDCGIIEPVGAALGGVRLGRLEGDELDKIKGLEYAVIDDRRLWTVRLIGRGVCRCRRAKADTIGAPRVNP